VKEEAADELAGRQRHRAQAGEAVAAVVLVAEGDAATVERDQAAVGDGIAVGVAREIGQHALGSGEGRLGVDHPGLGAQRREPAREGSRFGWRSRPCRRRKARRHRSRKAIGALG
jgi:hypothetical protein